MQPWHTSQNAFVNLLNYLLITSHPRPKPQRDSAPSRDGLSCHTPGHLWTSEAGKNGESWRIPLLACHVWLIGLQKELAWNLRVMSKQLGTTAMYSERFEVLEPPSPLGKGPTFLDVWQAISSTEKKNSNLSTTSPERAPRSSWIGRCQTDPVIAPRRRKCSTRTRMVHDFLYYCIHDWI